MPTTSRKSEASAKNRSGSSSLVSKKESLRQSPSISSVSTRVDPVTGAKVKSNRPPNSAFNQQTLQAWQPMMTAGSILPIFFITGLIFIPIGTVSLVSSNHVFEIILHYTDCRANNFFENSSIPVDNRTCRELIRNRTWMESLIGNVCRCDLEFYLEKEVKSPLFVYYGLTNFHQNHRRFINSRDESETLGIYWYNLEKPPDKCDEKFSDCDPFDVERFENCTPTGRRYVPCGAAPNSIFNDTFQLRQKIDDNETSLVGLLHTNIAWRRDKEDKFFNPTGHWDDDKMVKPPAWQKNIEELGGYKNESFIVWLRTAAFPTFRKLYGRVDKDGLLAGNYTVTIDYNFPVDAFDGQKRFIISGSSWVGGKNPFLGVAFIVVGSLCVLTGVVFLVIHMKYGKSLSELAYVD